MDNRNKLWRRRHTARLFKARMMLFSAYENPITREDGSTCYWPHWFELAKEPWAKAYKTMSTPCSCFLCKGERYSREAFKKETLRIIRESLE